MVLASAAVAAMLGGCASEPQPDEALRNGALGAAQQRGTVELACPAATAQVLSEETIQEPQGTGWYEPPHRAQYSVGVEGCGKRKTYSVGCDDRQKSCRAGPVPAPEPPPQQPADKMRPTAERVAQLRGAAKLQCAAATTEVPRAEVIQEVSTTGWSEAPHRSAYNIAVSGCGGRTAYLVTCDDWQRRCVAGTPQKAEKGAPPQLADTLRPDALRVAQQQGAREFGCPAATAQVLRQETIEEAQTTGWYEPPHRAVYSVAVSGCGKRSTYVVACNDEKKQCAIGAVQGGARR